MEWATRCVLLFNLLLIGIRLSTAISVIVAKESLTRGICWIERTTIASTVKAQRPEDCKEMYLVDVNVSNPSQELFESIADGLHSLHVLDSNVRSVYLLPNLTTMVLRAIVGGETQFVIDRKISYKLQRLTLTNLPRIPANLTTLQSLTMVIFVGMSGAKIDFTIFSKMAQLEEITLENFGNMIISNSYQLPSLRQLRIMDCPIKTENEASLEFPSLETLSLYHNRLQTIHQFINITTKLKIIFVDQNPLGRIALDDFAHLKQLESLTLADCEIMELSTKSMVHLPALKSLRLDNNKLTQLNVELWNMPKLNYLTVQSNQLKQIAGVALLLTGKDFYLTMYDNPCDCQWVTATREQFPEAKVLASEPCSLKYDARFRSVQNNGHLPHRFL